MAPAFRRRGGPGRSVSRARMREMLRTAVLKASPDQRFEKRFGRTWGRRLGVHWVLATAATSLLAWLLAGDWIAAAGVWVLWAGWHYLRMDEGPPVLALAVTFQWIQVTAGVFYHAVTGVRLPAMDLSDHRPMVVIGLGCLIALLLGLRLGMEVVRRLRQESDLRVIRAFGWHTLLTLYVVSVVATGTLQELAWEIPGLTQGIIALTYARLGFLFLIFRRLSQPTIRWAWIALFLAAEVGLGFTGYFAGFREPLMIAAVALAEAFDRRKAKHWVVIGILAVFMVLTGVLWMGVRGEYRQDFESEVFSRSREERLNRMAGLTAQWFRNTPEEIWDNVEALMDRLWVIYYPALAVSRVPASIPHEDGAILWAAVRHLLTPRLFFPDKPEVGSDSEFVREYSGVPVAGSESGTSIAFGYAGESYVDFGVPLMFLPILGYGLLMGVACMWLLGVIRHRELAIAAAAVICWQSLYLFERSWIKTLGGSATITIYLGGATLLLDRFLLWRRGSRRLGDDTTQPPTGGHAAVRRIQ
jgi:hypothetical protein